MQAVKISIVLILLLALVRFVPVYYSSNEFEEFVRHEASRARSESQLRQSVLNEAREYSLPVNESDIRFDRTDDVLRVTVDYKVPVNMLVYNSELKFHAIGSGLVPGGR